MDDNAPHHTSSYGPLRLAGITLGAGAAALIVAPSILPLIGVGNEDLAIDAVEAMHQSGLGRGFVGSVNNVLAQTPVVGDALVSGGSSTAVAVGGIGVGGFLAGKLIEKHESGEGFGLGRMVRYASLATSALIALPSALTAIGTGIVYMAAALDPTQAGDYAQSLIPFFTDSVGVNGEANISSGLSGILATLPHLLTCGASLIPIGLGLADTAPTASPPQQEHSAASPDTAVGRLEASRAAARLATDQGLAAGPGL